MQLERHTKNRFHFFTAERFDDTAVRSFERDRQDLSGLTDTLRVAQRYQPKEGPDRSQPLVALADRILAVSFQVFQERQDELDVQIADPHSRRFNLFPLTDKL